jgi:hypothetical protein
MEPAVEGNNSIKFKLEYATVMIDGDASIQSALREHAKYHIEHLNCFSTSIKPLNGLFTEFT